MIDYVTIISSVADDDTGEFEIEREVLRLPVVLMPEDRTRKFIQDIGYLAADKNFTYGGLNDYNTVTFLIDKYDLPTDWKQDLAGYIVKGNKRYDKVSFISLFDEAFVLVTKGVEGALPYARPKRRVCGKLELQQRADCELN